MQGFENGRLQTAARALGVMQAAYEAALEYAHNRRVFGSPIFDYQLTQAKFARMAVLIQATRQFSYEVARLMAKGEGTLEASMVKAYVCRAAEWVTREALQIHGGMGYAEEYPVSRYFVDARVLSIFEGRRRDAGPQGHRPGAPEASGLSRSDGRGDDVRGVGGRGRVGAGGGVGLLVVRGPGHRGAPVMGLFHR